MTQNINIIYYRYLHRSIIYKLKKKNKINKIKNVIKKKSLYRVVLIVHIIQRNRQSNKVSTLDRGHKLKMFCVVVFFLLMCFKHISGKSKRSKATHKMCDS